MYTATISNTYARRLKIAAVCSVLFHVLFIAVPWRATSNSFQLGTQGQNTPMVLNVLPAPAPSAVPQEPDTPQQLVDVHTPANQPVAPTDLIAVADSNATDRALRDGAKPGPRVDETAEHDALAVLKQPKPLEEPPATPPPAPESSANNAPEPDTAPQPANEPAEVSAPESAIRLAKAMPPKTPERSIPATEATAPAGPPVPDAVPGPMAAAQIPAPPAPEDTGTPVTRGRVYDKVDKLGTPGFKAVQSDVAPYMTEIRRKVQLKWNAMLLTRYSGSSPTEVLIECAIAPNGQVAYANIVGEPKDRVYAALCKEAVEKAGPFSPFPFKVPEMYRNKNLEIRWTFSFL